MSYLDRVAACNRLDLSDFRPLEVDGQALGWVESKRAAVLAQHRDVFTVSEHAVSFAPALRTPDARSAALAAIVPALVETGLFRKPRGEIYAVKSQWPKLAAFNVDRALVPAFGVRAYGVHINGLLHRADGLHLWIGTRAADRDVEPGKLDNMVAGGQPAHLSLRANVIKECGEEAGLTPDLANTARPVGAISYAFNTPDGMRADTLFCYDLEMPTNVTPHNTDGEISRFDLMPLDDVLAVVRDTTRFKFNVNLVILDFAVRHGRLDPDREPDLERIVAGLNRVPPGGDAQF